MASRRRLVNWLLTSLAAAAERVVVEYGISLRLTPESADQPTVVLVVGSDSRRGLTRRLRYLDHDIDDRRADAIGLLIVPTEGSVALVRVSRDAFMSVAGVGFQRIGWALSYCGSQCLIDSIRRGMGVPVHHYLEIGFVPFARLATSLGGLSSKRYAHRVDRRAGLDSPKRSTIWGRQVLALARSRTPGGQQLTDIERVAMQNRILTDLAERRSVLRLVIGTAAVAPRLGRDLLIDDALSARGLRRMAAAIHDRRLEVLSLPLREIESGGSRRSPFATTFDSSSPVLELDAEAVAEVALLAGRGAPAGA